MRELETVLTVIGESLVDIISNPQHSASTQEHAGGSPLNVAVGAARLGLQTNLVTHYAEDRYGYILEKHLRHNGVQVINGGNRPTSTALAVVGDDGAAEYTFSITWEINGASLPALAAVETSTHVHTGSIATVLLPGAQRTLALVGAAREHATISYDPTAGPESAPTRPRHVSRPNSSWPPATSSKPATKTWPGYTRTGHRTKPWKPG